MASNKNLPFYVNLKLKIILILYIIFTDSKKLPSIARWSRYLKIKVYYFKNYFELMNTKKIKRVKGYKKKKVINIFFFFFVCHTRNRCRRLSTYTCAECVFKTHKTILTNIFINILKVGNLIDYKSSFKSHQQFKPNTSRYIYI